MNADHAAVAEGGSQVNKDRHSMSPHIVCLKLDANGIACTGFQSCTAVLHCSLLVAFD